jgi:hypothetical protein
MQDCRQLSKGCWCTRSLQLRSGRSSSQYAPEVPSSARWNDKQNDIAEQPRLRHRSEAGWLMAGEDDADLGFVAEDGFTRDVVGQAVEGAGERQRAGCT